ncbi:ubiquinone biosynthesis protein COQ7 [Desulfitobacterium dichloroeliminans LMG P-21439]|uniref:Ubiquinone biosynthesis protein COQ7 n=1 Tax=Desulfitobacterium dichloroeliminans (strain LMG P-21439 / DCA1) TaxID=871963 RepID=L0F3U7_DESDL|nr:ferritin-like domain-containing protein [Desulfitobacterium dichloroeliminans]AGA67598.1 ubiquinone biosynthesis protein COQ7 [Desulfitobacterium dichloroeliminans LMG P-21439]
MDREDLLRRLNWFYSLEINQVELYKVQANQFKDFYAGKVFKHVASIEQSHVDNIANQITSLGGEPTTLGEVISPIIGMSLGSLMSLTGLERALQLNAEIERKAMSDYKKLVEDLVSSGEDSEEEICTLLKSNFIDEHLHTALFDMLRGNLMEDKIETI